MINMLHNELKDNYVDSITSVFTSITDFIGAKLSLGLLISTYSFFFNIGHAYLMQALLMLIIFDFITGIAASKVRGKQIKSRLVVRTPFKLFMYSLLVSGAHLTEVTVFGPDGDFLILEQAMIAFLAATEFISIIENAGRMGFGIPLKILNILEDWTGKDRTPDINGEQRVS